MAGNGTQGYSGDGGLAIYANLHTLIAVDVDFAGNIFIADCENNRVRRVEKDTGIIVTVAGNGIAGFSGDNGPAVIASLNNPEGLTIHTTGGLIITDSYNARIRKVGRY